MLRYNKRGFTLIELLIVIAIIGILAAIAIPMYKAQTIKARLGEVVRAIQYVKSASTTFYNDNNRFPDCSVSFTSITSSLGVYIPGGRRVSVITAQGNPYLISATIDRVSPANPTIDGDTIILRGDIGPDGVVIWNWDSSSTLDPSYMPKK
jgi:type IV pilus assembly protein PilA